MIEKGVYENIGYNVNTVAVNGQLITSIDQPEELIYGITKALWNKNTRKLLDKGHPKGKAIQPSTALKGVLIPYTLAQSASIKSRIEITNKSGAASCRPFSLFINSQSWILPQWKSLMYEKLFLLRANMMMRSKQGLLVPG